MSKSEAGHMNMNYVTELCCARKAAGSDLLPAVDKIAEKV